MPFRKKQNLSSQKERNMLHKALPNPAYQYHSPDMTPPPQQKNWKKKAKKIAIILGIILLLCGGWVGWKFVSNSAKVFGWDNLFGLFQKTKLKGEDEGRVNILLAGNSSDDPNHGGADLTDSIMIMSINTKDKTAFLLSVPRDLYVDIPERGYAKINEVYQDGEQRKFSESGYADGGMGLLEKVISQRFDITPHYYALVNYGALRDAVNAVGGITVDIQSTDPRGLYDPSRDLATGKPLVDLTNGKHTLNGQQALNLARARGQAYGAYGYGRSDFTRTENQQKILVALKDKAASTGTLSNPVKVGKLFDSMGNNVKTDMKLSEVKRLYTLTKEIPNADITSATLNDGKDIQLIESYTNRYGQSTLVPTAGVDDYSEIQAYIRELMAKPSSQPKKQ